MKSIVYFYHDNCPACESTMEVIDQLSDAGFQVTKENFANTTLECKPPSAPTILLIEDDQIFDFLMKNQTIQLNKILSFYPELFNCKNLFEYLSHILKTERSFKNEENHKFS